MVAVRIPGADSIAEVAPARDPGVRADASDFGADIGAGLEHMGASIVSLSAHLKDKRSDAENNVYAQTYRVQAEPQLAQAAIDAKKAYPDGGPGFLDDLKQRTQAVHDQVTANLATSGYTPSEKAQQHVNAAFSGLQTNALVNGVAYENNAQVTKLRNQTVTNTGAVASQVLSGNLSVDDGLKQVDGITASSGSLFTGGDLESFKQKARESVIDAAIQSAIQANDTQKAAELNARFYGGVPKAGQSNFERALEKSESGGSATLVNKFGYAGRYQFGAPRLDDLGVYTPGSNENLGTWSKTGKAAPGKWSGTFNVEGFPQVKTIGDFLASPAAQKAVFDLHQETSDEEVTKLGLDKFIGTKVAGVPITQDGLRAMIHLGGAEGTRKTLQSGGKINPADANGTTLLDYARLGARSGSSPETPNTGKALTWNNQIESKAAVDRVDMQSSLKDDLASVQSTGVGLSDLSPDRVAKVLGPNASEDWQTARARAKSFYDNTQDFYALPENEINARLLNLKPKPGKEEFVAQQQLFDAAQKKADQLRVARQEDPVSSVAQDPQVKLAAQGAALDDPAKLQPLVTARLAAQERAGISEDAQSPISKAEALTLTVPLRRMLPGQERQTLMEMGEQFKKLFGENADSAFAYALRVHKIDAATAQTAAKVMKKLGLGEPPERADTKATDGNAELSAAIAATGTTSFYDGLQAENDRVLKMQSGVDWPKPEPGANVPIRAIRDLRSDPKLAGDFDKKYGAGSSKKILDNYPVVQ